MESIALGTPVLGSRIRGTAELLSDDCGLLFDVGSPSQIAAAVREMISCPERRKTLVANARKKIEKYSLANVLTLHERIYDRLLGCEKVTQ